jgi:hypothetical protein
MGGECFPTCGNYHGYIGDLCRMAILGSLMGHEDLLLGSRASSASMKLTAESQAQTVAAGTTRAQIKASQPYAFRPTGWIGFHEGRGSRHPLAPHDAHDAATARGGNGDWSRLRCTRSGSPSSLKTRSY